MDQEDIETVPNVCSCLGFGVSIFLGEVFWEKENIETHASAVLACGQYWWPGQLGFRV